MEPAVGELVGLAVVTGALVGLAVVGNGPLVTSLPDRDMSEQALQKDRLQKMTINRKA